MAEKATSTDDLKEKRKELRKAKKAAHEALSDEDRTVKSLSIVDSIIGSEEYKNAKNILIYSAIRGEVSLEGLREPAEKDGKVLAYPLVISAKEMIALVPKSEEDWTEGFHGIMEPKKETCEEIKPEDFDLVICPCTAFDAECNRLGMGGGYYDRFLPQCRNAAIFSVAFEVQRAESVPHDLLDRQMDGVITEEGTYGIF